MLEGLVIFALLDVLGADVADEHANGVDVVGQADHAEDLDDDHAEGLLVVGGYDVSETYGQHDGRAPVVGPGVALEPVGCADAFYGLPVCLVVHAGHRREADCQDMREAEVKENHLDERPILRVIVIFYEKCLQLLHLLQTLRQFSDNEQSQEFHALDLTTAIH